MLQSSVSEIKENNWHHIAFSYDESGVNLYIDGVLSSSNLDVNVDTSVASLQNMVLGSNIDGFVDNVKIYDSALSQTEIQHLAFSGNYDMALSDKVTELKFNELEAVPKVLKNESGNDATISGANPLYTSGFVEGSKALVMNQADIALNDTIPLGELSMSAWVNLDNLTSGENLIVGNTAATVKFYLNNGEIKLKLNNIDIPFTDATGGVVSLKGERFNLNFNAANDLDTSPDAATNNQGVLTTTVNNGTFNNDVLSYPNASFYADKLTLSSWVKTNTDGTIFDLGSLDLSVNNNKLDVSIDKIQDVQKTYEKFDTNVDSITNNNNVSGIVGTNFNGMLIATNSIDFTLNTNNLTKLMPKRVSFFLPLRQYSPKRVIISGISDGTETELLNESLLFRNSRYQYKYDITASELQYDSIKVKFEGNGRLKVNSMEMFGYNYSYSIAYTGQTEDVSSIAQSGSGDPIITIFGENDVTNLPAGFSAINSSYEDTTVYKTGTKSYKDLIYSFPSSSTYNTDLQNDYTISFWIRRRDTTNDKIFGTTNYWQTTTANFGFGLYSTNWFFGRNGDSGYFILSPKIDKANTWYHLTLVKTATDDSKFKYTLYTREENATDFHNEVSVTSTYNTNDTNILFGGSSHQDNNPFAGYFDDFKFFNAALTKTEVEQLFNDTYTGVGPDILTKDGDKLTVNLKEGVTMSAKVYNITANTTTEIQNVSNGFSIGLDSGNVGDEFFVELTDASGTVYNSNKVNVSDVTPTSSESEIVAFHHGNFDNVYSDGTKEDAATNGHVYADTPTGSYSWGTLDSVTTSSTGTTYTWTPSGELTADVLMVAGGGGGGRRTGGGGGAGGLVFKPNIMIHNNKNTIIVGNGGLREGLRNRIGGKGKDSSAFGYIALGGGGGASDDARNAEAQSGGSGGGSEWNTTSGALGLQPTSLSGGYGNDGAANGGEVLGSGGGGAGTTGKRPHGGDGLSQVIIEGITYKFSDLFNGYGEIINGESWFAGGGAGGVFSSWSGTPLGGNGGGGNGSPSFQNGKNHTGGGGGGEGPDRENGSSGGSGIVLIKYSKASTELNFDTFNKLTVANITGTPTQINLTFTPDGSTTSQTIDVGTATTITISQRGKYKAQIVTDTGIFITDEITVASVSSPPVPDIYETLTFTIEENTANSINITNNNTTDVSIEATGAGWAGGAYVGDAFSPPVTVEFKPTTYDGMISLNDAIVADNGTYTSFDYGAYIHAGGTWYVINQTNYTLQNLGTSWDTNAINRLVYDGNTIKQYNGNTLMYTSPTVSGDRFLETSFANGGWSNVRVVNQEWNPTDGYTYPAQSVTLKFDGYNKLTIENAPANATTTLKFTPTGSTETQSIDIGTASTISMSAPGTYSAMIKSAESFTMTDEITVGAIQSAPAVVSETAALVTPQNGSDYVKSLTCSGNEGATFAFAVNGVWASSAILNKPIERTTNDDHAFTISELSIFNNTYHSFLTTTGMLSGGTNSDGNPTDRQFIFEFDGHLKLTQFTIYDGRSDWTFQGYELWIGNDLNSLEKIATKSHSMTTYWDNKGANTNSSTYTAPADIAYCKYLVIKNFNVPTSKAGVGIAEIYIYGHEVSLDTTPELKFDNYNKLTIENPPANATTTIKFTPTGSTDTEEIDIGTATSLTITKEGTYSATIKSATSFTLSNEIIVDTIEIGLSELKLQQQIDKAFTYYAYSYSMNADGTRLVVNGSSSNSDVYIYDIIDGTLANEKKFAKTGEGFSCVMSQDGNTVFASYRGQNIDIYNYSSSNNTWTKTTTLNRPGGRGEWGFLVDCNGDGSILTVIDRTYNSAAGLCDIYHKSSDGTWSQTPTQTIYGTHTWSAMHSVSINAAGDRLVIGEPGWHASNRTQASAKDGKCYIYELNSGGSWTRTFTISSPRAGKYFGYKIYMNDDGNAFITSDSHSGYYYKFDGSSWNNAQEFEFTIVGNMALSDNRILISESDANAGYHLNVYDYDSTSDSWVMKHTIQKQFKAGYSNNFAISKNGTVAFLANHYVTSSKSEGYLYVDIPISLKFDNFNKLTIENPPANVTTTLKFTPTGSTETQEIDIGTATSITINASGLGTYSATIKSADSYVFTNEVTVTELADDYKLLGTEFTGVNTTDKVGEYIAMSEDGKTVAISNITQGKVKVWRYSGSTWEQLGSDLTGVANENFGTKIYLSHDGNTVSVSAPNNLGGSTLSGGAVMVWNLVNNSWQRLGSNINGGGYRDFSSAKGMSADGRTIITGGRGDTPANDVGYVRIYEYNGSSWQNLLEIQGAAQDVDLVEGSISSDGKVVASSTAQLAKVSQQNIRVFEKSGSTWSQRDTGKEISGMINPDLSADGSVLSANNATTIKVYKWTTEWTQYGSTITENVGSYGYSKLSGDGNTVIFVDATSKKVNIYNINESLNWIKVREFSLGSSSTYINKYYDNILFSDDKNTISIALADNDSGKGKVSVYTKNNDTLVFDGNNQLTIGTQNPPSYKALFRLIDGTTTRFENTNAFILEQGTQYAFSDISNEFNNAVIAYLTGSGWTSHTLTILSDTQFECFHNPGTDSHTYAEKVWKTFHTDSGGTTLSVYLEKDLPTTTLKFTPTGSTTTQSIEIGAISTVNIVEPGKYSAVIVTNSDYVFTNEITVDTVTILPEHSQYEFSYTGSDQTFEMNGLTTITAELWGASGSSVTGRGPETYGGYSKATITVPSGVNELKVIVGEYYKGTGRGAYGGGGAWNTSRTGVGGGSGGGRSAIQMSNEDIITAGGGGGSRGKHINSHTITQSNGGGLKGSSATGQQAFGSPGTQSAGGAGAGSGAYGNGNSGGKYIGGSSTGESSSGGGGWYGGGGGRGIWDHCGSGGGGSGFVGRDGTAYLTGNERGSWSTYADTTPRTDTVNNCIYQNVKCLQGQNVDHSDNNYGNLGNHGHCIITTTILPPSLSFSNDKLVLSGLPSDHTETIIEKKDGAAVNVGKATDIIPSEPGEYRAVIKSASSWTFTEYVNVGALGSPTLTSVRLSDQNSSNGGNPSTVSIVSTDTILSEFVTSARKLSNNDIVYATSEAWDNSVGSMHPGNLFTGSGNWENSARIRRTTGIFIYKFTNGAQLINKMKFQQFNKTYATGSLTIYYYDIGESEWKLVTNPSSTGFPNASFNTNLEINFDAAPAQYWRVDMQSHPNSPYSDYIGLNEWEIHGVENTFML